MPILLSGIRPKHSKKSKKRLRKQKGPRNQNRKIDNDGIDQRLRRIQARGSTSTSSLIRPGGVLERALRFSHSTSDLANQIEGGTEEHNGHAKAFGATTSVAAVHNRDLESPSLQSGQLEDVTTIFDSTTLPTAMMTMSSLPTAPRVTSFYAKIDAKQGSTKKKRKSKRRDGTVPASKEMKKKTPKKNKLLSTSQLTDPMDYININPKDKQSPFAPKRHMRIVKDASARTIRKVRSPNQKETDVMLGDLNRRMLRMGAEVAALDEFTGLIGKTLFLFGGFGIPREKPGAGRKGWRNIWDATSILTSQKTVPREDIERAEGCSYYLGDTHSLLLERRPRWRHISTRHESRESELALATEYDMTMSRKSTLSSLKDMGRTDAQVDLSPLARSDHTVNLVRGSFALVFGGKQRGRLHGGDCNPLNDVCIMDLHNTSHRVWRTAKVGGKVISRRWGHTSAICGKKSEILIIIGGIAAASPFGRMDPYLDDSHQTSIPKREKHNSKDKSDNLHDQDTSIHVNDGLATDRVGQDDDLVTSPITRQMESEITKEDDDVLVDGKKHTKSDSIRQNAPPGLVGALSIKSLAWSTPKINAVTPQHLDHAHIEEPPYAMCGHSMDKVLSWQPENNYNLLVFGGWEWIRNSRGKIEGPSLSNKLRLVTVACDKRCALTWSTVSTAHSAGIAPGPRANHASTSNGYGLFIFGGRCIHSKSRNQTSNMMRHGSDTSLRLKYLNDLCVLIRARPHLQKDDGTDINSEEVHQNYTFKWGKLNVTGSPPRPRENSEFLNAHSGSMILYGGYSGVSGHCPPHGEHVESLPPGTIDHPWLDDLFVLRVSGRDGHFESDLNATWTQVLTGSKTPSPRCGHSLLLVDRAKTDGSRCQYKGQGLCDCVVGIKSEFTIQTYDVKGNPRWAGRDVFHVVVRGPESFDEEDTVTKETFGYIDQDTSISTNFAGGSMQPPSMDSFTAHVHDNYDGTYVCSYTAMVAGSYSIMITCNGKKVPQSPFSMWAQAGPATPTNSYVTEIDGVSLETGQDYPQFTLVIGETSSIGVTTKDKYGNLRLRGGEAWRLKTHVMSLSESIDGDSSQILKWRNATPLSTRNLSGVVRDMFVSSVKKAAAELSNYIGIESGKMILRHNGVETIAPRVSWDDFTGKKARDMLKNFVSKQVETSRPLSKHGSLNEICRVEDVVHRVFQRGKFMGDAYFVFSTTIKLTLVHSIDGKDEYDCGSSDSFFQKWSVLFHCINPEGGDEFGLLIEDASAVKLLAVLGSKTIESFRSLDFCENDGKLQRQYMCDVEVPPVPGPAIVAVTMDGRHICGSPFKCNLRPATPDAKHSYFTCPEGECSTIVAGQRLPLKIHAYDKNGIKRDTGGNWFYVFAKRIDSSSKDNNLTVDAIVADHGDGSYSTYQDLCTAGEWEISVVTYMFPPELRGKGGGNAFEHLQNSPFKVTIKHCDTCASQCILRDVYAPRVEFISTMEGTHLRQAIGVRVAPHRVLAGEELTLSITARDKFGNITAGHSDFTMQLSRPGRHSIFGSITTVSKRNDLLAQGPTHICSVTVEEAALYEMRISYQGDPLPAMPVPLLVEANRPVNTFCKLYSDLSAKTPILRSLDTGQIAEVFLVAKDKFDNTCDLTIDNFAARIVWPENSVSSFKANDGRDTCEIQPLGNGIYKCRYGSARAGRFSLHFTHDGKHITGSPVYIDVATGMADVSSFTCTGAALMPGLKAGTNAHITVYARDSNQNRLKFASGTKLSVSSKVLKWGVDPWKALEQKKRQSLEEWEKKRDDQVQRRVDRKRRRRNRQQQMNALEERSKAFHLEMIAKQACRQDSKMRDYCATMAMDAMCEALLNAQAKTAAAEEARVLAIQEHRNWELERSRERGAGEPAFNIPEPDIPDPKSINEFVASCYHNSSLQEPDPYLHIINDANDLKADIFEEEMQRTNNYGLDIDSEVSDDSEDDVAEYEEPYEFSEPITDDISATVTDVGDGTFDVHLALMKYAIGEIQLSITEEATSIHISGSPFTLLAGEPFENSSPASYQVVPNPDFDRYAGVPLMVRIESRSKKQIPESDVERMRCSVIPLPNSQKSEKVSNNTEEMQPEFEYHAPPPDGTAVLGEALELASEAPSDSTIDFSHSIIGATSYRVVVTMDGEQLIGSPFNIKVRGAKACAERCVTYGDGVYSARVGQQANFYVCICDKFGNLRMFGEDEVTVRPLESNRTQDTNGVHAIYMSSFAPGIYQCCYVPKRSGILMLEVLCNKVPVPESPLSVCVEPGAISAKRTTATISVSNSLLSPISALQLFEESKHGDHSTSVLRVHAGAPLRLVLHTRDSFGNLRSGRHSTKDSDLLVVRWKRSDGSDVYTDSMKPKLIPNRNFDADRFGTLQCIFQLLKEGVYTIFITAAEYTETRLGQYGCIKSVTDEPIQIRVVAGECHAPSSIVVPMDNGISSEPGKTSQFVWDTETAVTYSRFSKKKIMEIGMSDSRKSMPLWYHGPYSRSRRSIDVLYHGIYTRARQEMQDEIIRSMLKYGPGSSKPYFVLLTGLMGSGKRHTACWLNRAGRFPMESFLWVDPYQISLQLPEIRDLSICASIPKPNHRAIAACSKEAGCIAEILVGEALFRRKSIVLSTSTKDVSWWRRWLESTSSLYPKYRFAMLHVESSAEEIFARRSKLQNLLPLQPPSSMRGIEASLKEQRETIKELQGLDLWEYCAVIQNSNKNGELGPELISESGGQAWSVAPAPSEANGLMEFSDLELEAIAWRDQLSHVWVDHAIAMPRSRVPKKLLQPGFANYLNQWRRFCEQWVGLADSGSLMARHGLLSNITSTVGRSLWNSNPRLLLAAGDTAMVRLSVFDIYLNPITNVDATEIRVSLEEVAVDGRIHLGPLLRSNSLDEQGFGRKKLTCISTYAGDGSYECRYGSNKAGLFKLHIENSKGGHVPGSPYWLNVLPGEMHAPSCKASGPALNSIFGESKLAIFNIKTFDKYENPIQCGGHQFDVHIISSSTPPKSTVSVIQSGTSLGVKSSKKAALQSALQQASELEGEVELLSAAHAAVFSGKAAPGNVNDYGNGQYSVRFNPSEVPKSTIENQQSFVILVVDAESGEHICGSPFIVPCLKSRVLGSESSLNIDHIQDIVAGDVYKTTINIPSSTSSEQLTLPDMSIRPIWSAEDSQLPSQAICVFPSSRTEITALFSIRESSKVPLMIEAAYGGGLIKANGQTPTIPAVIASFAAPAKCTPKEILHMGGLKIAAAGTKNVFAIQARDRFGICIYSDNPGKCRARILSSLENAIPIQLLSSKDGVWKFEYWVPEELGLFGHSGNTVVTLDISVELWDAQRATWVQIGNGPYRVPVGVMLAESLEFNDFISRERVNNARIKMWKGHKGEGQRVLVGCTGKENGMFAIGDLRHFDAGPYTLEVEARGFFTRRFAVFVPDYVEPKTGNKLSKLTQTQASAGDNVADDIILEPPKFQPLSTSNELPRLRVLQQGDIDISDDKAPELKHLWWFAKKDCLIAASMKSSGKLIELNLDQCVALFGDDPESSGENRIPTSYAKYLEDRSIYNRKIGEMRKEKDDRVSVNEGHFNDGSVDSKEEENTKKRWKKEHRLCLIRNNIGMFTPRRVNIGESQEHTTTMVRSELSKCSEILILLSWNGKVAQGHSAPTLKLKYQTFSGSIKTLCLGVDPADIGSAKKEGILTTWQRDDRSSNCSEFICLREIPSDYFALSVVPVRNMLLNEDAAENTLGEATLTDLSMGCATIQCYHRMGEILKCTAIEAVETFLKSRSSTDDRNLVWAEWSLLTCSKNSAKCTSNLLTIDNQIRTKYENVEIQHQVQEDASVETSDFVYEGKDVSKIVHKINSEEHESGSLSNNDYYASDATSVSVGDVNEKIPAAQKPRNEYNSSLFEQLGTVQNDPTPSRNNSSNDKYSDDEYSDYSSDGFD